MTKKTYLIYRILTVLVVSIITSTSVNTGNWYLLVVILITAWIFLSALKRKVKDVLVDERDYQIAGKASLHAMTIFNMIAVTTGLILYISGKDDPVLFSVGNVLVYSACFLMFLYAVLFKIYVRKNERN
jgi:uncharacterized membrane protein